MEDLAQALLAQGDLVGARTLVEKVLKHPHRGWIVVFKNPHPSPQPHRNPFSAFAHWLSEGFGISTPPDEDFIKRVIGLPGETVQIRSGGTLYVDGRRIPEPYLPPGTITENPRVKGPRASSSCAPGRGASEVPQGPGPGRLRWWPA